MSGPTAVLIPAAGASRRMGRNKLLLPWGGTTVIGQVVTTALAAPVDRVVVVLGNFAEAVAAQLTPLKDPRLRLVRAAAWDQGMLASVQTGVDSLPDSYDSVLLSLGDQPATDASVYRVLLETAAHRPGRILIPTYGGRRGHPTLLPLALRAEIMALNPAQESLRTLLQAQAARIEEIPVSDPGIRADLDTPDDYRQWSKEV